MARPTPAAAQTRPAPPPAAEPGTLVRLKAAAAAVGVDEDELKRRAAAAGVKMHTVVRAGEAQAALDLADVWRLRGDNGASEAASIEAHPSGIEIARLTARFEREAEDHRARHAEALERTRWLEDALRVGEQSLRAEKSRHAQLEAQLSESARTLAETQRAMLDLRASQAAREREVQAKLEEERKLAASSAQALEQARVQAQGAANARAHAEERLQASDSALAALKAELSAARADNERQAKELGETKALRAKVADQEAGIVKLNATLSREQAETKAARELAASREAELARIKKENERLVPFEKRAAEEQEKSKQAASAAQQEEARLAKQFDQKLVEEQEKAKQVLVAAQQEHARLGKQHELKLAEAEERARQAVAAAQKETEGLRKELEQVRTGAVRDLAQARQSLDAEKAKEFARRDAALVELKGSHEQQLAAAQAATTKAEASRGIFERELTTARLELEKLEETCAKSAFERERLKQRGESLSSQLAAAQESESAIQRYADRKEAELAALREERRRG